MRRAFTGFTNSVGSDVHLMLSQRLRWSTLCDVMHGLLQLYSCWGIQVHHRQAPASTECCRSRRQRHAEVYDRGLSHLLHNELHWLDVPRRVQYKLCATVHRCLQHKAPQYMTDCCIYTPQTLLVASICGPPVTISCSYRDSGIQRSVVGPDLWLARRLELVTRLPTRSATFL